MTKTETCYKCGETEGLSKRGKTVMICKPCRREQYRLYKASKPQKPKKLRLIKPKPVKQPVCSSCGTTNMRISFAGLEFFRRNKCEKCACKVKYSHLLQPRVIDPEWDERARLSAKRIAARFR